MTVVCGECGFVHVASVSATLAPRLEMTLNVLGRIISLF